MSPLLDSERNKPPMRPYVKQVTDIITDLSKRFQIVDIAYSHISSIFYADIVILYTLSVLWNRLVPLPRLEWLIFTGLSFGSFFRVFYHSKAIFSNSLVMIIAITLKLSDVQLRSFGTFLGDIDFITILTSIIIYQITIQDFRGDDPNAQVYWVTFIISDM